MARGNRIHSPGAFYHVMLRGNNGQNIFFSNWDRIKLCFLLQEGVERFGHRIHCFCFMSNHIHLAIEVAEVPLSRIVQNFAFRYSQYFNRKQRRIGHLFQRRFKSVLIDAQGYLVPLRLNHPLTESP